MKTIYSIVILLMAGSLVTQAAVWPGKDWERRTPELQGMSAARLDELAEFSTKHGGAAGCVIRNGYIVKEWGSLTLKADTKSNAKGTLGATMLAIALDEGRLNLDDLAQKHYPNIGAEKPENTQTGWLKEITVRHLATMTAGFDDGRPPKLYYRPGTAGHYSNDTSNMLAELLTLLYGEDLYPVFKRKVMDPIGAAPEDWAWRRNSFRAKTINDLTSREFASGLTITYGALARVGYLYLRGGEWNGKQIVSKESIRRAVMPTDLPAPYSYYGHYWGTNERGTYEDIPKDVYWALGLGDSFVLFCPSLDIVAVRLGTGSKKSQLPGADDDWGGRVAGFFRHILASVQSGGAPAQSKQSAAPYPPSPVIKGIEWAPADTVISLAKGSDNWPMTWADDDNLYTAYGDGFGFEPFVKGKLSMGLAKVTGIPPQIQGINIRSETAETRGDGAKGRKASGMLMVDGVLYMLVRNAGNSHLGWSADHGLTWTWADWKFTESFGCPIFLNFGRNYAGARDRFVYIYSQDHDSAYERADRFVMARVPKEKLRERGSYEFFVKLDAAGQPVWSKDVSQRGAVFSNPGKCYRSGITYHPGTGRYLWCQIGQGNETRFKGGFAIFDAPEPWGPWTTVFHTDEWDIGPGETNSFPAKWMSDDGRTLYLVSSSNDNFTVRRATLIVLARAEKP